MNFPYVPPHGFGLDKTRRRDTDNANHQKCGRMAAPWFGGRMRGTIVISQEGGGGDRSSWPCAWKWRASWPIQEPYEARDWRPAKRITERVDDVRNIPSSVTEAVVRAERSSHHRHPSSVCGGQRSGMMTGRSAPSLPAQQQSLPPPPPLEIAITCALVHCGSRWELPFCLTRQHYHLDTYILFFWFFFLTFSFIVSIHLLCEEELIACVIWRNMFLMCEMI